MSVAVKFSPKEGFPNDWQYNMIGYFTASAAIEWGKIVAPDTNNVVSVASDYGYFLMQEITSDGPSELERITGDFQMHEVKVGKPVSCMLPIEGARVYTKHVVQGGSEPALAKGQICEIVNGVYSTKASLTGAAVKGKIIQMPADNTYGLYVVEIMNT